MAVHNPTQRSLPHRPSGSPFAACTKQFLNGVNRSKRTITPHANLIDAPFGKSLVRNRLLNRMLETRQTAKF